MNLILESWAYLQNQFVLHPIAQTIGLIAFFVAIYNFIFCKDKKFIIVTAVMSLFWGVHYLGIGAISAGLINLFDVFKNAAALKWERNKYWMWGFMLSYIVIGIVTFVYIYINNGGFVYRDILQIIPTMLGIFSTFLVFKVRGIKLKLGFFISVMFWLAYNILSGSIGGMITDIFIFFSSIIGISKDLISDKREKQLLQKKV